MGRILVLILIASLLLTHNVVAQNGNKSAARIWMELCLDMVKQDGLGPTVHARNIHHLAAVMYDAWQVYEDEPSFAYMGKTFGDYTFDIDLSKYPMPENKDSARDITIHYAAYRLLTQRFNLYASKDRTVDQALFLLEGMGFRENNSMNYSEGSPAALGNYIAQKMIDFGLQEPISEEQSYANSIYNPINEPMEPNVPGNSTLEHPNRWQPLSLLGYIKERGWDTTLVEWNFLLVGQQDEFLTPHWGLVQPFAMGDRELKVMKRDGQEFNVYNDPGPPPLISEEPDIRNSDAYKWNFALVSSWSGHCDPNDTTIIDISPLSVGTTDGLLPTDYADYPSFYDLENGGTKTKPAKVNPYTGKKYEPNLVKRGDYVRVIAEYWVDGVNTYTPPGHWMSNLIMVSEHPQFEKRWKGKGPVLDDLEWDIRSYLTLSGALHDAGISAWSVKAYYDYVRPISAIRWMGKLGQSSDPNLPSYHPMGLPLIDGHIELIKKGDPLAGKDDQNVGKIKLYAWNGPTNLFDLRNKSAGVGWITSDGWWPYQRYTFATPPFAGYISGHSTFSTAASEVLTLMTGSPFFPGGLWEITMKKDKFLVFENGPSEDITLQWATYREASDETCLSRIWGGIHPPVDDIQGRLVGIKVARNTMNYVDKLFGK